MDGIAGARLLALRLSRHPYTTLVSRAILGGVLVFSGIAKLVSGHPKPAREGHFKTGHLK